jgi:hypothetical protein
MRFARNDLALSLFVARIAANNVHATLAADHFAVFTHAFDTAADFHCLFHLNVLKLASIWRLRQSPQGPHQPFAGIWPSNSHFLANNP